MANLSSGESSKPQSPQKAFLMGELANQKRISLKRRRHATVGREIAKA